MAFFFPALPQLFPRVSGIRVAVQYTATYNAYLAAYRQTALTAFQQVEDYLAAVRIYSQEIQREQEAVKSAEEYLNLEMVRYETGVDPYLYVITAQTTVLFDRRHWRRCKSNRWSQQSI